ncbi:hypothetical protein GCM10009007_02900 [Formosimonas limnophila]|uniref:Uncharacterized protein n=1 Tax=Formosimonas limnophila TaxID=1384487 RepID=A0A8J3CJN3_9BURK|nr:hypothetical protein [Formosimonas limnophila]GHA65678.1 hypothetical protein GCM10009007_02900 [Formosimonas limnophila]
MNNLNLCKVCGADFSPFFPWGEDGLSPSYDICSCCGTEFGYEDVSSTGILKARQTWIDLGMPWKDVRTRPKNWDSLAQLKKVVT